MKGIDLKGKRVPIELDRTRYLIYDLNTLAELEEKIGELDQFFKSLSERVNQKKALPFKTVRLLLWAGLVSEDEKLTEKQVGSFVFLENIELVTNKIIEAVNASMPLADNQEDPQEKKPVSEESTG